MQFNMAKSKVMNLGSNNSRHAYQMSGQHLCITEEEVDIGVALALNPMQEGSNDGTDSARAADKQGTLQRQKCLCVVVPVVCESGPERTQGMP
jgi:hypothetical protein